MIKTAIIVTTYNRPDALDRVLESVAAMTVQATEVMVADDGSGEATARVIEHWKKVLPLSHVWQPDEGFRAAEARNKAVLASSSEYIIFLDGDCMVPNDFVRRHQCLAESGFMVAGNRILFSQALTDDVLQRREYPLAWTMAHWFAQKLGGRVNRLLPLLRLPDGAWRKKRPYRWQGVHTCNLGLWRNDFEAVNGFDQSFQGWGHEDADLSIRLMRNGVFRKEGGFAVPVLHLWHPENDRQQEINNRERLARLENHERPFFCKNGMVKSLD